MSNKDVHICTAEELSHFIRRSILIFLIVGVINAIMIFWTQCSQSRDDQSLAKEISKNRALTVETLQGVAIQLEADKKWREEFAKANPKAVVPKVIEPTPKPVPVPKPTPPPSIVIVIPSPPPVIKREVIVKHTKPKPTPTPFRLFDWGPKSRTKR